MFRTVKIGMYFTHRAQCVKYRPHIEITITLQIMNGIHFANADQYSISIEEPFHIDSKQIN